GAQTVTIKNPDGQSAAGNGILTIGAGGPTPTPTATPSATPTVTPTATPTATPIPGSAVMISPSPGTTFNSSTVTFTWSAGNATAYFLWVGNSPNKADIYNSQQVTVRSETVTNIPT